MEGPIDWFFDGIARPVDLLFERELYKMDIQIGADHSVLMDNTKVFVLKPDFLWGQVEYVDYFHGFTTCAIGQMAHDHRDFQCVDVISAERGPAWFSVRALQRAFRRRRYTKWYCEEQGWDRWIKAAVAFAEYRGRVLPKCDPGPFAPGLSWGYDPGPAVAGWPFDSEAAPVCVPALGSTAPAAGDLPPRPFSY